LPRRKKGEREGSIIDRVKRKRLQPRVGTKGKGFLIGVATSSDKKGEFTCKEKERGEEARLPARLRCELGGRNFGHAFKAGKREKKPAKFPPKAVRGREKKSPSARSDRKRKSAFPPAYSG